MEDFNKGVDSDLHKDKDWVVRRYFEDLELSSELLKGKKVLDLGAGKSGFFAEHCREQGITPDVVSLDLEVEEKGKKIVANALALPFKDESFDLVVSYGSIPSSFYNSPGSEQIKQQFGSSLEEMLRVAKPGGEIRIYPVYFVKPAEERTREEEVFGYDGSLFDITFDFLREKLEKMKKDRICNFEFKEKEQIPIYRTTATAVMVRIIKT